MPDLPEWPDMSDLDKGAALLFLCKIDTEGESYARNECPCRYFNHPKLVTLSEEQACDHACSLALLVEKEVDDSEYERLYDEALEADVQRMGEERKERL